MKGAELAPVSNSRDSQEDKLEKKKSWGYRCSKKQRKE